MHARHAIASILIIAASVAALPSAARAQGGESAPRRSRDVLLQSEMLEKHYDNLQSALEALRPLWIRPRNGAASFDSKRAPAAVEVYFDNVKVGTTDQLREISVRNVSSVRFLDGPAAQARFGVGHESGIILVSAETESKSGQPDEHVR